MLRSTLALFMLFVLGGALACASGPHPALEVAAKDLGCEEPSLTLHEIYPNKVRVEGCDKEGTYVKTCDGYGVTASCGWAKLKPKP